MHAAGSRDRCEIFLHSWQSRSTTLQNSVADNNRLDTHSRTKKKGSQRTGVDLSCGCCTPCVEKEAREKYIVQQESMNSKRDEHKFLYLPKSQWSPRFEDSFYTVRVEGFERCTAAPTTTTRSSSEAVADRVKGHSHHPAFYYKVVLHRGTSSQEMWRRFSQFVWLYRQVQASPPPPPTRIEGVPPQDPLRLPPGTCWWPFQSEDLATKRVELLSGFLDDMLSRPGYASHPAVLTFLEIQ